MKKRIGLMTGGGDAPGLNGILESVSRVLLRKGYEVVGIQDGFEGIFNEQNRLVSEDDVLGLHSQAGTFLGTSNKSRTEGREAEFLAKYKKLGLEGMVVAGGDGTFAGLRTFQQDVRLIGVPKTIDNDLAGTEITFGFDTAVSVVAEAADALKATADAHRRVILVEAMGRTAGWIALGGGLASYADAILTPERPYDEKAFFDFIRAKKASGRRGLIVIAGEGAHARGGSAEVAHLVPDSPQAERLGGIAEKLARQIERETAWDARHVVLGHLQRARPPTTTDRFLTVAMGVEAARMVEEGAWDQAVVYRKGTVCRAPISDLMQPARTIPDNHRWLHMAQALGIFV
jgi:6-phosphofructokinase